MFLGSVSSIKVPIFGDKRLDYRCSKTISELRSITSSAKIKWQKVDYSSISLSRSSRQKGKTSSPLRRSNRLKVSQRNDVFRDVLVDGFVPSSTSVAPMFPLYEYSSEWDDFGEVINPDDYVIKGDNIDSTLMHVDGDLNGKLDEGTLSFCFAGADCLS